MLNVIIKDAINNVIIMEFKNMLNVLSLQQLKRTGFTKLKQMFQDEPEIVVQERGRDACVLVNMEYYNY